MKASNKVIVVTGGGSGIGRELVLLLLRKGAKVAAVDISESGLQGTIELAGDRKDDLSVHVVNIADLAAVEALPVGVIARHGAVDGVINNAGIIQPFVRVNDLGYDAIERVMNVNFYGVVYMTKVFLPYLLDRPESHIVNVSSMGGFFPFPGQSMYGASKAAVKLLTEGLYTELAETNVDVTIVFPGAIATNIAENSGVGMGGEEVETTSVRMTSAGDAARMIVEGMERDKYRVLVGSDAKLMDFIYRISPKWAAGFIHRQMRDMLPE